MAEANSIAGIETISSPFGGTSEGNLGNGYVKLTLVSL